jgi:putative ABC transport system permease protein
LGLAPPLTNGRLRRVPPRRRLERARSAAYVLLSYTVATLWQERARFLSAILAVAFSATLVSVQWGVVLGIYACTSLPIDRSRADVWVGAPSVASVDAGLPISESHLTRLAGLPGVERTEPYILGHASWVRGDGTQESAAVIGSRLTDESLGASTDLTPGQQALLAEPGAVIVDEADQKRLGIRAAGDHVEVSGHRVRVVGFVHGAKGLSEPYLFCSLDTARLLCGLAPDQTTYLLARCRTPADAEAVTQRLSRYSDLSAHTSTAFSARTRRHWLFETPGGMATTFLGILALLVGAAVTRQTLYAATLASVREFALLRALGIRRWRIGLFVLCESLGVGVVGVLIALPLLFGLGEGAALVIGTPMLLPADLLAVILAATVLLTVLSGLATLRSLRLMDPLTLLR